MVPKSKLILIMAALSLRKKKICGLALLVMLGKVENEDKGRRFWVRKIFQERKKFGLYHILTDELPLFDKEYFFRFVRMTRQRFEHLLWLVGPHFQRTTTKMRELISRFVAELAGIFIECSFKFISRLKAYDKISKKNWYLAQGLRLCLKVYVDSL